MKDFADKLLERFLRYVKTYSQSDSESADNGNLPSTPQQWDMAKLLEKELNELGLENVQVTENCYVYACLPAVKGYEDVAPLGLLAHMDTVEEVSGKDVKPQIVENYDGKVITLTEGSRLDPAEDKYLAQAALEHDTIIHTDGTTLLGADDKAGVAAIMTAIDCLKNDDSLKHGKIEIIFSPDEETGHGMDKVPLQLLSSKKCYTVDGGHIGELETECFNAYKSDITFIGKSLHTGSARPGMVNAITMASSFVANLPRQEAPETTDNYQGFYAAMDMTASVEKAHVMLLLRDFTKEGMEKRIKFVDQLASVTASSFGGKVEVKHTQQYLNMKEGLDKSPEVVENLIKAYSEAGVKAVFPPIRGGTDGSRLTEMGIPTPNIFTGGHNYHSRTEWASFSQMKKATEILVHLAVISTKDKA
ncbi:MAG: peptidase T [Treponema sp.]|nr:peptidase T [Treponema sp.]